MPEMQERAGNIWQSIFPYKMLNLRKCNRRASWREGKNKSQNSRNIKLK